MINYIVSFYVFCAGGFDATFEGGLTNNSAVAQSLYRCRIDESIRRPATGVRFQIAMDYAVALNVR